MINMMRLLSGQAVAFSAAAGTLYIKGNQPIAFNHVILNMGGGYDVSSGKFTCPLSGIYMITFFIGKSNKHYQWK